MSEFSTTFDYMYAVSADGAHTLGTTVSAGTPLEINGTAPTLDANGQFVVAGSDGPFDGTYTFESKATAPGGEVGFTAKDAHGHTFFFAQGAVGGGQLSLEAGGVPICFLAGTAIATPAGEVAIEALAIGDLVLTADGRAVPVRWIGRQTMVRAFADATHLPIHIHAHALEENRPARDLFVSPNHALMIDGILVQAGCLVNGTSIVRAPAPAAVFIYYHVEVDGHALILAENTPAETFLDTVDRGRFDNWEEHERLYGEAPPMAELPLARAKAHRQVPVGLRARLEARGAALTGQRAAA